MDSLHLRGIATDLLATDRRRCHQSSVGRYEDGDPAVELRLQGSPGPDQSRIHI